MTTPNLGVMCRPCAVRSLPLVVLATALLSCRDREPSRAADTMSDSATAGVITAGRPNAWSPELGQLLLVPSVTENAAVLLFPETPAPVVSPVGVTLLSASGDSIVARVAAMVPDSVECGDAPLVRFETSVPQRWSIGLAGRSASSLPMDSIAALPPTDSSRLAADIARLASALPMRSSSRFTGLPFSVLGARRFETDGREVVVAQVVRRLSQEAAPLEERTLIIGERPTATARSEPYTGTYSQRTEALEEAAEHYEVLAAIRGRQSTMLWLARDKPPGTTYELLERANGGWHVRWSREC